ncbi:uracil-DNA glycosylase [Paraburkholderia sp. BL21I4N1]|uniref:uracil-DNA glycosylase n=1 Tax=Paraburkholderia sp. BL21I4N1 TaxID=1938801 RepID=UPI000CFC19E9|nr:uracil-DNA glycosylase [Paraburkholderia sp. BL21I4N1]PQV53523.1 DNA polymerase [Paraburkholderia sp. BL21I4N1]
MALHDSVLEEFGLAPLWVRRGMAEQPAAADAASGQDAAGAGEIGMRHAPVNDAAAEPEMRRANVSETAAEPLSAARTTGTSGAATMPASEASRPAQERGQSERLARPSQPEAQPRSQPPAVATPRQPKPPTRPAPQSRVPEQPPSFDTPPDDDFAWFDDLPTEAPGHVPSEARRETPQPPAIHTLDWDALSERVAACESCRLCEKRTRTVFGVGDRNADWMLIGEAPGENEDRQGEPFVGQAGKLLDNMLRSLTLARDTNVYIANVIKCRPPGNRNPEPDEVARCEPYLQRQVALVKPKLIVALGRFAAQSLLKTESSISSLRGRVHEYEGVPVIVTYHPAYLLRSLPDKAKAWADLCLARDTWRAAGGTPANPST